jgi:cation diffusion facilitator CzcD-associated flavoprotein CzcO
MPYRVVIIGAGFGGIGMAIRLSRLDRRLYALDQPMTLAERGATTAIQG